MAVMGTVKKWSGWSQMLAGMLAVQVFATGQQLLSKVILTQGTFIFALMAYRHLVASLCVAPLAFFFERITAAMGLFYYGLRDTTATYSTNFLNIIPIVTFVFSVILGIEKVGLGSKAGKIKTAGAFLCVGGALTTSLYKGKAFHVGDGHHLHRIPAMDVSSSHWTRGTLMLVGEAAQSIPIKIQGNAGNMHHCVPTIRSNRAMLRQEQGSMEARVEFAADHNSLLGSTEYCSNILLAYMSAGNGDDNNGIVLVFVGEKEGNEVGGGSPSICGVEEELGACLNPTRRGTRRRS
ncbi:hypothetical protein V6N13_032398 [Hibiscus sabdariffa]